jgi:hypothetical protein
VDFLAILLLVSATFFLVRSPRHGAVAPLLVGACYMTLGQQFEIGPLHFFFNRILVAVGWLRVVTKGERISGGFNGLDWMMIVWGCWTVFSSSFHQDFSAALIARLALVYDSLGLYLLLRVFIQATEDITAICRIVIVLLIPIAVAMIAERLTGHNAFSMLGGVSAESEVRGGQVRAQGPFAHSILAGTVGAVCWPFALRFWKTQRHLAMLGFAACGAIVITSSSSGPIMTVLSILLGLALWKVRSHMRLIRWGAVLAILALALVMKAPVYYLLSRIDLTGSSTGWHRSALIEAAINHLDEWWLAGTDYTRHWMPTGVGWSEDHTDITNQYIKMGVIGGLPSMLLFIGALSCGWRYVGQNLRANGKSPFEKRFLIWTFGAILFGHATTFMSVSYFDQSIVFFLLVLAVISSFCQEAHSSIAGLDTGRTCVIP